MNKKIYLLVATYCASITASDDIDPTKFKGGVMGNYLYQASKNLVVVVDKVPMIANETGAELMKGLLSEIPKDKQMEIGANLMKGALIQMNSQERQKIAYDLSKGALEAAATVAGAGIVTAKDIAIAKTVETAVTAKVAATAALTSPIAPFVFGGAGMFGYGMYLVHLSAQEREKSQIGAYKRCLNTHLNPSSENKQEMNHDGTPHACKSTERTVNVWFGNKDKTNSIKAKYHKHRQNGGHFKQDYK